ncbi:MAG: DUF3604 domain-containing protein, partial [Proteobacteria bacterium]|nr:DUF3604 domain-containing protein [Pseudomonadota bacterium]
MAQLAGTFAFLAMCCAIQPAHAATPERNAYFGDTHIHTLYSFDAFMGNVRTTPDDAYRYAKGEPIDHPAGLKIRISGPPLDFLMVSDHAKYLGVFAAQVDPLAPFYGHPDAQDLVPGGTQLDGIVRRLRELEAQEPAFMGPIVWKYAWQKIIAAAQRHNDPGTFTTFIGYEYTPTPGNRHLHRNVLFRGSRVPDRPFSSGDSLDPEDLWDWLDRLRADGIEALAIPHNMNQSDGLAFQEVTFKGSPIDREFAEKRMRNEPIAEISQQKGTSETHPSLSPNDEWADFQIVQYYLNRTANTTPISVFKGGYYRDALNTGLKMQAESGFNPFQLGVIGASDSHLSGGPYEEDNYFSGGRNDAVSRGSVYPNYSDPAASWEGFWTPRQATHGTGGLAGVWAEENTRDSLYDAMRRRETFATSGSRIRVRFFGGDLPENIADADDPVALAYTNGVSMGGMLATPSKAPRFLVWAVRDPHAGWLQRVQIIKGWVEDGEAKEAVYDVGCSDGLVPDPNTHRCPDNGAKVNLANCSISSNKGAVMLKESWLDYDFEPDEQA